MKPSPFIYVLSFILGIIAGGYFCHTINKTKEQEQKHIVYPHIYNKPDTIQIIIDDKGWQVEHPYKRMRGN